MGRNLSLEHKPANQILSFRLVTAMINIFKLHNARVPKFSLRYL